MYAYIQIDGLGASPVPPKAQRFPTLSYAEASFHDEAKRYFRDGGEEPLVMYVYEGDPSGDEERYGYPDTPDFVLRADCNVFIPTDIRISRISA